MSRQLLIEVEWEETIVKKMDGSRRGKRRNKRTHIEQHKKTREMRDILSIYVTIL